MSKKIIIKNVFYTLLLVLNTYNVKAQQSKIWQVEDYEHVKQKDFRSFYLFKETIDLEKIDYARLHAAIFYATNEQRIKYGKNPLQYAPELEIAAYNHSHNMVEDKFFSHEDKKNPERETPNDRARLAGIQNPSVAENIAEDYAIEYKANTPVYIIDANKGLISYSPKGKPIAARTYLSFAELVVNDWMNSEGHRKNILSDDALQLGCGAFFYRDAKFNNVPMFKVTQNFQLFESIVSTEPVDKLPGFIP